MSLYSALDLLFQNSQLSAKKYSSLCQCHEVVVHHDDYVTNNACDLLSVTSHDGTGTAPFSSALCPLLPFSHSLNPALSDPLSGLGWPLSQGKALFSAGQTVPLGKG